MVMKDAKITMYELFEMVVAILEAEDVGVYVSYVLADGNKFQLTFVDVA